MGSLIYRDISLSNNFKKLKIYKVLFKFLCLWNMVFKASLLIPENSLLVTNLFFLPQISSLFYVS